MQEAILGLVSTYGYGVLFILVALESLGIPLPGETALVTAAALAALGRLSITTVVATSVVAAIFGDNGGYWIGHAGGMPVVRRYGHLLRVNESHLERAHRFFERHGAKTVFLGRFVTLLRTWVAVFAGAARMPYGVFMAYNALGAVCWSVLFGALGYLFGRELPQLKRYIAQASLAFVLFIALVVALAFGLRWFEANRNALAATVQRWWQRGLASPRLQRTTARHPTVRAFVSARFARGEVLGLHLTLGLAISLAGLWLFGGITEDVIHHDPLTRFDVTLLHWFQAHATPAGDAIFGWISLLGSPVAMAGLGLGVAVLLAMRRRWILLGGWVAAFAGGGLIDAALKLIIRRPRPPLAAAHLAHLSWSFPSGHAMGSLIGYGMLAYVLTAYVITARPWQVVVVLAAALLTLAIGFSRLYLGVHYFSDVIAGYAAGVLWLSACITGLEIARSPRAPPASSPVTL